MTSWTHLASDWLAVSMCRRCGSLVVKSMTITLFIQWRRHPIYTLRLCTVTGEHHHRYTSYIIYSCNIFGLNSFTAYFLQNMGTIVLTPKRTILARKHVVWVIKCEDQSSGSTWAQDREKKVRTVKQKSHKVVTFRLFGEKPPLHRLKPKFAWWVISLT